MKRGHGKHFGRGGRERIGLIRPMGRAMGGTAASSTDPGCPPPGVAGTRTASRGHSPRPTPSRVRSRDPRSGPAAVHHAGLCPRDLAPGFRCPAGRDRLPEGLRGSDPPRAKVPQMSAPAQPPTREPWTRARRSRPDRSRRPRFQPQGRLLRNASVTGPLPHDGGRARSSHYAMTAGQYVLSIISR